MSRISSLGTLLRLPAQIISSADSIDNSCDSYRSVEWAKYAQTYHNLLYSNPVSEILGVKGFLHLDGTKYKSEYTYKLHLNKILKDSLVKRPKMIWLPCMDERIQYLTASHHALSLGMPGCECLMSYTNKAKMIEDIIDICKDSPSIQEIITTSHSDCGAVDYAIKKYDKEHLVSRITHKLKKRAALIDKEGEKYALHFTRLLEKSLKENNLNHIAVRAHHFQQQELHSQHLHNALGAIVNFNPLLNSAELEENLEIPMFNIYAGGQKISQIIKNIDLALRISAGSHGFSNTYFNKENPFILLFIIPTDNNLVKTQVNNLIQKIQAQDHPIELVYTVLEA
jgi:carbonic anhydrase